METELENENKKKFNTWKWSLLVVGLVLVLTQVFDVNVVSMAKISLGERADAKNEKEVLPPEGVVLPIPWAGIGEQMIETGVIDFDKFKELYAQRNKFDEAMELLYGSELKIDKDNSNIVLNILWAFGLSNKNIILEEGPMIDEKYGGDAGRFASTGGWSLSSGDTMDYYSKFEFITLTSEQQTRVEQVSKNIYRPCCGNSTFFPDCNHGMAMLGLLELLASQGMSEGEMYAVALKVNAYWFPDTYLTIAKYFAEKDGIEWEDVDAKKALGYDFSSSSGYRGVLQEVSPPETTSGGGGGGCGI